MAAKVVADSLRQPLYRLAGYYENWGDSTATIVDSALAARFRWLTFTSNPGGYGLSGTITNITVSEAASEAVADMIADLVVGLFGTDPDFDYAEWHRRWLEAGRSRHEVESH